MSSGDFRPDAASRGLSPDRTRRLQLAALPIHDKLLLLIRMQQLAADIASSTGRPARQPWPDKLAEP